MSLVVVDHIIMGHSEEKDVCLNGLAAINNFELNVHVPGWIIKKFSKIQVGLHWCHSAVQL